MRMGPDVPLLDYHKRDFVLRRFTQTALGGPRLKLGQSAPSYVFVNQIVLFLTPWVLGGVGTVLYQLGVLQDYGTAALSGGLMLAAAAVIQGMALEVRRRRVSAQRVPMHNNLTDEDLWEFTSCAGPETVKFLIPGKKYVTNVISHSVLAGVLCALGTWYLLPNRLTSLYGGNVGASITLFVFGWLTVCVGEYSLIVSTPAETAVFQVLDTYEITALMRPFYILVFVAVDLTDRFTADVPGLKLANQILHVVFLFLPVFWMLGVLPPLDALFLWGMEQLLEFGLGGSPMSSDIRLLGMVLVSVGTAVASYFIPSSVGVVIFMTGFGFVLSLDLCKTGFALKVFTIGCFAVKKFQDMTTCCRTQFQWRETIFYLTVFPLALLEASLLHYKLGSQAFSKTSLQAVMSYVLMVLLVVMLILQEVQTVYVFGIFRNPFYPKDVTVVNGFVEKQKGLSRIGAFRRILTTVVSPFALIAFLSLDNSLHHLPSVSLSIGFTRSFRMVWQNTECVLLDAVVVSTIQLLMFDTDLWWNRSLNTGTRLLLVGFIRNRLFQFVSKLQFAITVLWTSWAEKKQRRTSSAPLIMLNVIFFPVLLTLIAVCALLSSPLLPLFSLPVFLIGFPRPIRSWPGPVGEAAYLCQDTVYYQQMVPSLATALQSAFSSGSLGLCLPGSHYLCRFQDRLVWIHVVERGYTYCCVNIKGLELEETSCHTAEVRRIDDIFETAFECKDHPRRSSLNCHFGNLLTPRTVLPTKLYSDARNVLSGIIDLPENRQQMKDDFIKVLLWLMVQHCYTKLKRAESPGKAQKRDSPPSTPSKVLSKAGKRTSIQLSRSDSLSMESIDDWTDNRHLFDLEPGRRTSGAKGSLPRLFSSLPGSVEIEDELEDRLYTSMLPALPTLSAGKRQVSRPLPGPPPVTFSSRSSELLAVPSQWRTAPYLEAEWKEMGQMFPEDWFCFVLRRPYFSRPKDGHFGLLGDFMKDPALREVYLQAVLPCWIGMFGAEQSLPSPGQIVRTYNGDIPWSTCMRWLEGKQELFRLALRAFRYTVKLMVDQASLGPFENFEELLSCLEGYESDWFIGVASEKEWQQAVLREKPFLFSLGFDAEKGVCTSRTLTLQEFPLPVGKLRGEAVRGQWANLSWEMLYATNDDEERFSVQAHLFLLRNLSVQAADPPHGSPVYSSAPLHVPLL
ncbi:pecanex-like protein 4 [Heteronotia binoei]|uniref:pecanex-like protein 4 n=1 Tax=Heteronotia binoei TaxID=13085 RepID=UPI00292F610F|nr:pecanex-like protein 4 [Heteronotia binoei]